MDTREAVGREYLPRVIDGALQRALTISGAVVLEGARAVGKTMTALHAANSFVFIDDAASQQLLEVAPAALLEGQRPRLLDEWQLAPELWNLVRRKVDATPGYGQFILTGSSVPSDDSTRHTGAGRFLRLRQRTLTWWEKLEMPISNLSLASLFEGSRPAADLGDTPELRDVIALILKSGFPAMSELSADQSAQLMRAYIAEVSRTDIQRLAEVRQSPDVIRQLILSLARSVSSEAKFTTIAADLRAVSPSITAETVSSYVDLLQRLFVVEPQRAWSPALRSRARLRTSSKYHLLDPALTAASLGASGERLFGDLETLGLLFESAVVHDLTVHCSLLDGEIYHYRDSNGKEIDVIIVLPDGRWGAVEVKLGGLQVPRGAASLSAAVDQIDVARVGEPAFKLVVTGTGPILTLDDGTITCPLSALRP